MNYRCVTTLILLNAFAVACHARIIDDFSEGGWSRFSSTPGTISAAKGKLTLKDGAEAPDWVTVSKKFMVDVDQTPNLVVRVAALSGQGTVKLIRKEPYDKQVALQIGRAGEYVVNMQKRFGWKGKNEIEVCLYAIGAEEEITYQSVAFTEELTQEQQKRVDEQVVGKNTSLDVAPFEVVAHFNTCSYYFTSPERDGLTVSYRKPDGAWLMAYAPVYVYVDEMYRGSIVDLEEDTDYELKISSSDGQVLAQQRFRTWRSEVSVGKTIMLDEASFKGNLEVRESGTEQGWIRITSPKDMVLKNDRTGPMIDLYKVEYVIIEGLTLRGGLQEVIRIRNCRNVRVVNCDIAGWGRVGTQRFDLDGKYYTESGRAINWDCAILVSRSVGTVIERCYIHDPVNKANSWYYSHPAGPEAIGMDKSRSTVLRYNDFIGSDRHRWNDAVEGSGNFHVDGGFDRDGDIYGNMMCFANDDALEIDGGQTNVRVFDNKFEGCLCGVSIQGCMSGPSYLFRNLLVNMGDETGLAGQTIKTSSNESGPSAVSFIFNNTCDGRATNLNLLPFLRIVAKNNIFGGQGVINGRAKSPKSECDYNLFSVGQPEDEAHGILGSPDFVDADAGLWALSQSSSGVGQGTVLDNFMPAGKGQPDMGAMPIGSKLILPVRPIPVGLDRYQIRFSEADVESGLTQMVTASVESEGFSGGFRIAQNEAFDWFTVTPQSGVLGSGQQTTFKVKLTADKMGNEPIYRGAFLIRLENGYSRPVMVYARKKVAPEIKPGGEDGWVVYCEAEQPGGNNPYQVVGDTGASGKKCLLLAGSDRGKTVEFPFTVPKGGKYFVVLRVKSANNAGSNKSLYFGIDQGTFDRAKVRTSAEWGWSLTAHNRDMSLICLEAFDLSAGDHVLKLGPQDSVYIDLAAITDNPGMFEQGGLAGNP